MSPTPFPSGRRERNKQEKLGRITAAAQELFAERGVDEVTTQEIARRADVASGTLFLYARNKGELLLLVQNSTYAEALDRGRRAAETLAGPSTEPLVDPLAAIMAIVTPIVDCNRVQAGNGRIYLREVLFGDPQEPHHREALSLTAQTEAAIAAVLQHIPDLETARVALLARVASAVMFLAMSSPLNAELSAEEITRQIRDQLEAVLPS